MRCATREKVTFLAELRGGPTRVQMSPAAADTETGRRLWELSEHLTDVQFVFPTPD